MNCLDSSFWIEYFLDSFRAQDIESVIRDPENLVVPSVCLVEVGRYLTQSHGEIEAAEKMRSMGQASVVPLESAIAGQAVALGREHKLALADSIVYATARVMGATLWTLDKDFEGLPHVKYFSKKK